MDARKLANGPNQLAGLLGKVPEKAKAQVLDLQNRPAAFHEGSQPTRRLAGRDVSISSPLMGARIPTGKEYTLPGRSASAKGGSTATKKEADSKSAGPDLGSLEGPPSQALTRRDSGRGGEGGGSSGHGQHEQPSQTLVKYEGKAEQRIVEIPDFPSSFGRASDLPRRGSFDLSAAAGGHDPLKPVPKRTDADSPARMTAVPEHVPTPMPSIDSPRPSLHRQDTRPHVDPGLENLHFSQPDHMGAPPPKYSERPPEGHKTTEVGPGVPGALDAAEAGEKKMSLGKKMMLGVGGVVALLGATFLMSTPTPPPPPEKST